jgi:phosphate transport system substrate-binding protein
MRVALLTKYLSVVLASTAVMGCSPAPSGSSSKSNTNKVKLQGSGASFPAPIYAKWFQDFSKGNPGVTVDYQAKGSGAGIKDLINETVDFAASDAGITQEEIEQVKRGVVTFPLTAGKIVLSFNLPGGPSELKLSREAYTKILKGDITKWNDPTIVACNDGFAMPEKDITVVVRSDSSGTTYILAMHLSAIDPLWKETFGINKSINWPNSPRFIKGPKNDGVAALIKQTPGAIGYVEYGFAKQVGLTMASLENRGGRYIKPTMESGVAALESAKDIPNDLQVWVPEPDALEAYPIASYTYLLCYKNYNDQDKSTQIKRLVEYCLTEGQKECDSLGYIPLPATMIEKVRQTVSTIP